ncbi:MAG: ABC transporter substrate-binding protein [Pyrinomonadaceae bacterium]
MPEPFTSLDTVTTAKSDAAAERVRTLIFNSLVRKDANFDYVGELAGDIKTSDDGKTLTFTLRDGVKFHNGKIFTSADVKYTIDQLLQANGYKAGAFFDTVPDSAAKSDAPAKTESNSTNANAPAKTKRVPHIDGQIETPDAKTVVIKLTRPSLRSTMLSNLVAIPIIPEGTISQQKDSPIGSGPFKFVSFDASQNILELAGNADYWDTAPVVQKLRLKTVTDATSLQAELQSGGIDIAPNPSNMPPDMIGLLNSSGTLKVEKFDGSNIQYVVFNTQAPPLNNPKVRQAIGYAINRERIVKDLLQGQATMASSILPAQSWAYAPGQDYKFDAEKAKQLLAEAGYKGEPIVFKYGAGNAMINQYSQVIQSVLNDVGFNIQIETLEPNVSRQQQAQGQFQMGTGAWIGGNTDPIFLRDLFHSTKIPSDTVPCCNRSRYTNPEVDKVLEDAVNAMDKAAAKDLYIKSWNMISADMPMFPLWYPANIVVSNKRIGNIKMSGSGDWVFLKDVTLQ